MLLIVSNFKQELTVNNYLNSKFITCYIYISYNVRIKNVNNLYQIILNSSLIVIVSRKYLVIDTL